MPDRLAGICLPTGHDYSPWSVALGECYPDVMVGDLGGADTIWDGGALPFIHLMFKAPTAPDATIQNIAAGQFDNELEAWLKTLKAYCDTGRKAVVVYLPEFNSNWCVYANDDWSPGAFVEAWYNFVDMGRDVGLDSTMVKWCWAPNQPGYGGLADWYPGDDYVDIIGGSLYNWGGIFNDHDWLSPAEILDPYVTEIRAFTDKPIVATQIASGLNDTRTPQWLDDLVFYTNTWENIDGFIWYNEAMFEYGPGRDDFNDRVDTLDAVRPDYWFEEDTVERHTAMLWLPYALRNAGVNVIELDGWDTAQGAYQWTDLATGDRSYGEEPTCYMVHHTATSIANPVVRDGLRWSKANCWAGLWRNGRLHQTGGGVPTVVFTSAGPARISSGYGHGPTLHEVAADVRVPWKQSNPDTGMAANRYAWNVETVAEGDGSAIDPGVEHALVVMGALMCDRFDWSPWRTIGHLTWTKRKPDPYWNGRPDVIVRIQDAVAEMMNEEEIVDYGRMMAYVKEGDTGFAVEEAQVKIVMAVKGVAFYGNSNRVFVETEAPILVFKVWDQQMTAYFSAWTGRNSYGYGPTEKIMVEEAIRQML